MKTIFYEVDDADWAGKIEVKPIGFEQRMEMTQKLEVSVNGEGEVSPSKMTNTERAILLMKEFRSHILSVDLFHKPSGEKVESLEDLEFIPDCVAVLTNALVFIYQGKKLGKSLKP